jgi:hypothetical protein
MDILTDYHAYSLTKHLQQPEACATSVFALRPSIHTSANQDAHCSNNLLKQTHHTHTHNHTRALSTSKSPKPYQAGEGVLRMEAEPREGRVFGKGSSTHSSSITIFTIFVSFFHNKCHNDIEYHNDSEYHNDIKCHI